MEEELIKKISKGKNIKIVSNTNIIHYNRLANTEYWLETFGTNEDYPYCPVTGQYIKCLDCGFKSYYGNCEKKPYILNTKDLLQSLEANKDCSIYIK